MKMMSFLLVILGALTASASNLEKLTSSVSGSNVTEFKKIKVQLKSAELERLLEIVLSNSNPEFLRHTLIYQKEALPTLKKNPDLTEIAITEAPLEILKELDKKIPLDSIQLSDGRNLLHTAASSGTTEQIEFIINRYPKMLLDKDKSGENPLSSAARRGDLQSIESLFKGKVAPVNLKNQKGEDAIAIAQAEGFKKSASLIEKKLKEKK